MQTELSPRTTRKPSPLREATRTEKDQLAADRNRQGFDSLQALMAALGLGHVSALMEFADHITPDTRSSARRRRAKRRSPPHMTGPNARAININLVDRHNPSKSFMPK